MALVTIAGFMCERCSHKWISRENSSHLPIVCPKCKSPYWNVKRKTNLCPASRPGSKVLPCGRKKVVKK